VDCRKLDASIFHNGMRMWSELLFVWSQFTRLTEGRTDGRADVFLISNTAR